MDTQGAILIVTRNNIHLTRKALKSALAQTVPCNVMVIDNQSTDGSGMWLSIKDIATIHTPGPWSLSHCWNCGIRNFFHAGYNEVLVINNDVEIPPYFYQMLQWKDLPFVTGVSVNDRSQVPEMMTGLVMDARPHPDFSAFMIRRYVTERVGWFDEGYYPAYYEDNDYHVRMHRAGITAVSINVPFYHAASQTLKNADPADAAAIRRGADRNKERFRKRYGCVPGTPEYDDLFTVRPSQASGAESPESHTPSSSDPH